MKAKKIIEIMERYYPTASQEEWDNGGLQIGDVEQDVSRVMISLNADIESLNEAIAAKCQMLITHHPFCLEPMKTFNRATLSGNFLYTAIENHIVVYSSHTALDKAVMGEWLLSLFDIKEMTVGDASGISRIGKLNKSMTEDDFLEHVKAVFKIDTLRYAGTAKRVQTIAICGGSGADLMESIYGQVDAYLTGDTKYRHAKDAKEHQLLLVDIHHHAENIMVKKLKDILEKELTVDIIEGSSPDYYSYR